MFECAHAGKLDACAVTGEGSLDGLGAQVRPPRLRECLFKGEGEFHAWCRKGRELWLLVAAGLLRPGG